jgi:GT2 family glycosyltransferase
LKPVVSIIIVNWNGHAHLEGCFDSLAQQSYRDFEVLLVDNGSTDDSLAFTRERYPWVKPIPLEENTGFATGNNRGLAQARGRYLVTLNNDTRVEPDWLEELVEVADAHPRAGMIGSRICSYADPDVIDSLGMGICPDGMSRGHYRNRRWSESSWKEVEEILFPSACAALYKREMIEEIGFFDDDFFAYAEDSDLGLRGRIAGWDALLATRAIVYHKYSQTGGSLSPFKVYLVERNHYWVVVKNHPLGMLFALPFYTLLRYGEQVRTVLRGGGVGSEFRAGPAKSALVKALLAGVAGSLLRLPRMLSKRRRLKRLRRLSSAETAELLRRYRISFRELLDNS